MEIRQISVERTREEEEFFNRALEKARELRDSGTDMDETAQALLEDERVGVSEAGARFFAWGAMFRYLDRYRTINRLLFI